jgi:hypothetical protein
MSGREPGIDRAEWTARYASLDEDLLAAPVEAMPAMIDLVEDMLAATGHDLAADVEAGAREPETVLARARELVDLEERGGRAPNDDAFQAAAELRSLYRGLVDELSRPADDPRGPTSA